MSKQYLVTEVEVSSGFSKFIAFCALVLILYMMAH